MNAPSSGKGSVAALSDFILLNEEIAALANARLPLESHLAQLGAEFPGTAAALAERVGRRLEAGDSLAAAMDTECGQLPPAYRAVIIAGAESGQLGTALESVVDTASRFDQLRRVTGVAILYPLLILVMFCVLLAFILRKVVPNFEWLRESHFGPLAWLTKSPTIVDTIANVVPLVAILGVALWWYQSGRISGMPSFCRRIVSHLPGLRQVVYWGQAATFAELLRLLLDRGLPMDRAMSLAADAVDNDGFRGAAQELSAQVRQGNLSGQAPDGEASRRSGIPMLIALALRHASDRQLLTASLDQASRSYRDRAIRAADWCTEILPIVLTIGIGGTVTVAFALVVFWPYVSTLRELAQWNWR